MTRDDLQYILNHMRGVKNVYYQPPPDLKLRYPCIVYKQAPYQTAQADNHNYRISEMYLVTAITKSPDWHVPRRILELFPSCRQEAAYIADGLYHYRFLIHI